MTEAMSFAKQSITSALTLRMFDTALSRVRALGMASTIAFVDENGVLKSLVRLDGAPSIAVRIAQDKAYTAAGFEFPPHGLYDFIKDHPSLAIGATDGIDRLVTYDAVGVSGGHFSEDMEVAQTAIDVGS